MNAPSITPAQILAALGAVLGLLVSFAILDEKTSQALAAAASILVPFAITVADAIIRNGRAQAIGNGATISGGKLHPPKS